MLALKGAILQQPVREGDAAARRARQVRRRGPGAIWYRIERPLVEGEAVSQVARAVVAADFCNGTSAALDFRHWTFLNATELARTRRTLRHH